jgi:hypothetical protein
MLRVGDGDPADLRAVQIFEAGEWDPVPLPCPEDDAPLPVESTAPDEDAPLALQIFHERDIGGSKFKFAILDLPGFYGDPEKAKRTAYDVVKDLIEEAKKAKAAPVVDEDDEPEVRKPEAKETAVPAKKSKLADIVADWDDE